MGHPRQPGALAARTSRTRSRTSTSGAGNEPIVTFDFTDKGRKAFQTITREIAQRGADNALPGVNPTERRSQHFAIVLDNELVSAPYINYRENPDGIDGATGAADLRRLHDPDARRTSRSSSRPARCRSSSS